MLVNSSGHCQYLPPGKHHCLGPPHLDSVGEVGVPSGAPRGSSWLCALGILSYHTCLLLLPSSPPGPRVFPECWQCHLPVFLSWDHGSSCLCQHLTSVLIVCLVFFKFLPQLKQVFLVRSFPSSLQSASQFLGHFFPRNPNFPSHYTGYLGRCCPPDVDLAGLAS